MLNSTWAAGESSSWSQRLSNLLGVEETNPNEDNEEEQLYGRGHPRNAGPPPCGTGGRRRY
ncbi:hypothetical protein L195_g043639 [Trifolium pratense]|uniref:Uncharacterized protein n=1 Tax=Trifolium pratense TaxID=57577 RepID=A0A2K3M9T9_TRIPR|nr:hypothetical protein L195_g043639 [Trifolium pratense]